jgi:hypothetical protein
VEITQWTNSEKSERHAYFCRRAERVARVAVVFLFALLCSHPVTAGSGAFNRHTREYFRYEMPRSVRADHPVIVPVAEAIRAVTRKPLEQIVMVNDITHLLVDYDEDERVYGSTEFHATFEEMLAKRREAGWLYLRDDCDGRAVFAAHLLAALGIEWRLDASFWKQHAWIVARVNGVDYDLLDLRRDAPEIDHVSYKLIGRHFVRSTRRPPPFSWRRAWQDRTHGDVTIGLALGMLAIDSQPGRVHQRYATDWTQKSPAKSQSPIDARATGSVIAGFPYGEPRFVGALASASEPADPLPNGLAISVNTGAASSPRGDAAND